MLMSMLISNQKERERERYDAYSRTEPSSIAHQMEYSHSSTDKININILAVCSRKYTPCLGYVQRQKCRFLMSSPVSLVRSVTPNFCFQ